MKAVHAPGGQLNNCRYRPTSRRGKESAHASSRLSNNARHCSSREIKGTTARSFRSRSNVDLYGETIRRKSNIVVQDYTLFSIHFLAIHRPPGGRTKERLMDPDCSYVSRWLIKIVRSVIYFVPVVSKSDWFVNKVIVCL